MELQGILREMETDSSGAGGFDPGDEQRREDADAADLVRRFQAGDRAAFTTIYSRYFERVYAYLRLLLRSETEAMDGTQQVFLKFFEKLPTFELRPGHPPRAWLFRVARNHALTSLTGGARTEPVNPADLADRPDPRSYSDEPVAALDWLRDADLVLFIERLPLAQRQVLLLRYVAGMSGKETAAVLDRSLADVNTLHHRAVGYLRKRLLAIGRGPSSQREDKVGMKRWRGQAPVARARRFAISD